MSKNVLIIEDDITNITLIKRILTKKGISVESASDAISAWEKIHDNHYDLFIIDLNLPLGANGFEFLSRLRSTEEYKTTPAVAITAYISIYGKEECLSKGFNYYLEKPFDILLFSKLIEKLLSANNITYPCTD
ncbi:MAG: response regulator [Candidatus Kapaibacteriota bacterium]